MLKQYCEEGTFEVFLLIKRRMLRYQQLQCALSAWVSETLRADVHRDLGGLTRGFGQLHWLAFWLPYFLLSPVLSGVFTLIYPGHWLFSPVLCVVTPSSTFYPGPFSFGVTGTTVHAVIKQKVTSLRASDQEALDQEAGCRHPSQWPLQQGPTCSVIHLPNGTFTEFVSILTVFFVHLFVRLSV